MSTRLGCLCDRVIEAGWLVALVVTVLFFNIHSDRIFEADKIALLRSIVLIMVLAWGIKGLETWRAGAREREQKSPPRSFLKQLNLWGWVTAQPIPFLALLFLADYVFATVVSVTPRLSLWGSYERLQGLYTTGAYLIVFFSLLTLLRTQEQRERLLTTVLVVSLPVSLYGIIQHVGTDPVPWLGNVTHRVTATLGNPIFVAAFLIMIVPLTLYRLLETGHSVTRSKSRGAKAILVVGSILNVLLQMGAWWRGPTTGSLVAATAIAMWFFQARGLSTPLLPLVRFGGYSVLLSTQLVCIVLTQSRGPWLGLLSGMLLFVLLWALIHHRWRWTVLIAGGGFVVALLLLLIPLIGSDSVFLRDLPYVGRLSRVFEGTGRVRLLIWQGTVPLILADPVRTMVGYGPETMHVAYHPYYPPELGRYDRRNAFPDRSHNQTFDVLVTTGVVGLTIHLCFFTSLFCYGLKRAGIIRSWAEGRVFLGFWLTGGAGVTLLVCGLDHSWHFFGVALPIGMLGGLFAYLGWYGLSGLWGGQKDRTEGAIFPNALSVVPLLSALIAHFTEMTFGIAIASTRTYFWTYTALLLVAGCETRKAPVAAQAVPPPGWGSSEHRIQRRSIIAMSVLVSCVITTLVSDFLSPEYGRFPPLSILWLLGFTWVFAGLIVIAETGTTSGSSLSLTRGLKSGGMYLGITLVSMLIAAAVHVSMLRLWNDLTLLPVSYAVCLLLTMLALGGALLLGERLPPRVPAGRIGLLYPVLAGGVLLVIVTTNLDPVRADVFYRQAWVAFHFTGQPEKAIALGRRALELAAEQDFYSLFLSNALIDRGRRSPHVEERTKSFLEAEQLLTTARALNPLKLDYTLGLAQLHRVWAQHAATPAERDVHFRHSLAFYEQAATLSPHYPQVWNEWGRVYVLRGEGDRAQEKYQRSLALDDTFDQTYLHLGALLAAQGRWPEAARAYEDAVARNPRSVQGYRALGSIYTAMGRLSSAVRQYRRVLELAPNDHLSHIGLAQLYRLSGSYDQALLHAQHARKTTPPAERPSLEAFITRLRQQQDNTGD